MIINALKKIFLFFYKKNIKRKFNLKLGRGVTLNREATFEGYNFLSNYSSLLSSHIGYASYLGERTVIKKSTIGKYTSIGPDVKCIFGKHPSHTFVSTHPAFFSLRKQAGFTFVSRQLFEEYEAPVDAKKKYQIVIGNDVWIGAGVSLMDGVTIGNGAIIASNSLVIKDVPPYAIVGGVPAKIIKYRFEPDEIDFLEKFKWWQKNPKWLKENSMDFINIAILQKKFN